MRRNKFPLNRFGAVGDAVRRSPFGAGEQRVLLPFSRRKKAVAAVTRVNGCSFCPRGQTTPQAKGWFVCRTIVSTLLPDARQPAGMPASFTGEEIPCRPTPEVYPPFAALAKTGSRKPLFRLCVISTELVYKTCCKWAQNSCAMCRKNFQWLISTTRYGIFVSLRNQYIEIKREGMEHVSGHQAGRQDRGI